MTTIKGKSTFRTAGALGKRKVVAKAHGKATAHKGQAAARVTYPASYAGMWVAWTPDGRRIVASSKTLQGVEAKAMRAGHRRTIVERIPRNYEPVQDALIG